MAQAAVSLQQIDPRTVFQPITDNESDAGWLRSGTAEIIRECQSILRQFAELPEAVRDTTPARVEARTLTRRLLRQLISQPPPPNSATGWSTRILKREESLSAHVGRTLYCVLIRLPGVQYTVELDPDAQTVVHWEWQST